MIHMIVAMDKNRAIGVDGRLPWHLSEDLKHFKKITMGHAIIMGRKTFDSIGKPLPGRQNIVLTTGDYDDAQGINWVHSLDEALSMVHGDDAFVIGGSQIYRLSLPQADVLHLTEVDTVVEKADAFFPQYDTSEFSVEKETQWMTDEKSGLRFRYKTLTRS